MSMYVDGDLDTSGLNELQQLLADDPVARSAYVDFMTTHSDLTLLSTFARPTTGEKTTGEIADLAKEAPRGVALKTSSPDKLRPVSWSKILSATAVAVACTALAMVFATTLFPTFNSQTVDRSTSDASEANSEIVARIVRKIDCDWEGDRWEVVASSDIVAGQTLMMRRGLMEIEFLSGARVTLEGPVVFTAESPMNGFLSKGKLTSVVPESAHGFTVDTPDSQTVDLGTEFGMFVDEDGVTETHVFDGEVIVRPSFAKQNQEDIHLSDDMAVRAEASEQIVSPFHAVPSRFAYCKFDDTKTIPPPVVDRKLALWLSAEHLVQVDEEERVRSWGDIVTTSNTKPEVAWQVEESKRPLLVESAIGKQPAVRFLKKCLMVTEPIALADEQTIVSVFKIDRAAMEKHGIPAKNGRQLLNLNGPPHLSLRVNDKFQLMSQNYAGIRKTKKGEKEYLTVGRLKHEKELGEEAIVAVSLYSTAKNTSQLYINGKLVDQAKAPPMKATRSSRYIGSHMFLPHTNFLGDVGEVMIYDTSLTKKEIVELSKSMIEKYEIDTNNDQNESPKTKENDPDK